MSKQKEAKIDLAPFSRRDLLKTGALATAALLLPTACGSLAINPVGEHRPVAKMPLKTPLVCNPLAGASAAERPLTVKLPSNFLFTSNVSRPIVPAESAFRIRGIKGWNWTPQQYLEEIPRLPGLGMNFLMNCYLSLFTHAKNPVKNEWWRPLPEETKRSYQEVIRACKDHGIDFCFALHPQLFSSRPMNMRNEEDFESLWQNFAWAQDQGVRWFCLCCDDVNFFNRGVEMRGLYHAKVVNRLLERLRVKDAGAKFILCPTWYTGVGAEPGVRRYLEELAGEMDPDVYCFWVGGGGLSITAGEAETYKNVAKHRLILWDNYPVNNASPALHLGPVIGRDPGLPQVVDGYMSNPLSENQINRLPMFTCAQYAADPKHYNPRRSIGLAIAASARTKEQEKALKDMVELYPGNLACGTSAPRYNPVRTYVQNLPPGRASVASDVAKRMEDIFSRFETAFPDDFRDAKAFLRGDIQWVEAQARTKRLSS